MDSIAQLFDRFSIAYQHSLYAIQQEEEKANKDRLVGRANIQKRFEKERSKSATATANNLMATLHKLKEVCSKMSQDQDTVIRCAEYLSYGKLSIECLKKMIFSDISIPCIIPLIGHGNVLLESKGDECNTVGLQIALQALQHTAPGQLSITVINPELRPEFSVFTRLTDFQILAKTNEIQGFIASIVDELVEIDSLLQGRYSSLVELRKVAQQPVGRLRLIVIQELPNISGNDFKHQLIRVLKGASRAGIAVVFLHNKNTSSDEEIMNAVKRLSSFSVYEYTGDHWYFLLKML